MINLHVDAKRGQVWMEMPATPISGIIGEYLYYEGLVSGLGSNPVGLDRGQLGGERLVVFRIQGGRLLIEQKNLGFRALSENAEKREPRESRSPGPCCGLARSMRRPKMVGASST